MNQGLEASAWSVCSFPQFSTSMVQYTTFFGPTLLSPLTSITITLRQKSELGFNGSADSLTGFTGKKLLLGFN